MAKIKVTLENENGNRLLCCGDLIYQDSEPHIHLSQDENPSLKVRRLKLLVESKSILKSEETYFDFECIGSHAGAVNRPGAF